METQIKPPISLMQNSKINFLTTNDQCGNIILTGETSIDLMVGDELNHPYYKKTLSIHKIIETRESKDVPGKTWYKIVAILHET